MRSAKGLPDLFAQHPRAVVARGLAQEVLRLLEGVEEREAAERELVVQLFKLLTEDEQLRVLKAVSDGEDSGLSLKVRIESLDAARVITAEIASLERARAEYLGDRLQARNRKPEQFTVTLARTVDELRNRGLSWAEVAEAVASRYRTELGLSVDALSHEDRERLIGQCRQAHRRHVKRK